MSSSVDDLVTALLALTPEQQDAVTDGLMDADRPWGTFHTRPDAGKTVGKIREEERARIVGRLREFAEQLETDMGKDGGCFAVLAAAHWIEDEHG